MADMYGGHIVARYLKDVEGVDTIFSLSGGHINRIYDGILEFGIRLIDVRHEQAAAMMAHAWSMITGQPGVCLATAGPGFTNTLTGIVNACQENAPIVLINGMAPVKNRGMGALQDIKQADMIKSTVKWFDMCLDPKRIPEYIATAFRHAVSGRPGPVFLEFPPDVLNIRVESDPGAWPPKGGRVHRSQPDPALFPDVAERINRAEKPLIIGGSGVGLSRCDDVLKAFIEKTGMPFALINAGRGVVPDDHPLSLWDGGMMGILTALGQADLILALGVRFNWLLMFGQIFPQAEVIRVDIDATELDRNRAADVGLVGDVGLTLKGLYEGVERREHSAWRQTLKDLYMPLIREEVVARDHPSDPIHPARLVSRVREAMGDEAIYVVDGGDTSYFGLVGLNARERAAVLQAASGQFGCLGTGVPFAVAAKAARPEKTVVVINGDGSFGLNAMEFCTAVRHNLPFVCVVNNDGAWGMIKHGQEMGYGNERVFGTELGAVRYDRVAKALGGYGELVEKDQDIIPALKRAVDSGKPACINVLTDPCVVSPATLQFVEGLKLE